MLLSIPELHGHYVTWLSLESTQKALSKWIEDVRHKFPEQFLRIRTDISGINDGDTDSENSQSNSDNDTSVVGQRGKTWHSQMQVQQTYATNKATANTSDIEGSSLMRRSSMHSRMSWSSPPRTPRTSVHKSNVPESPMYPQIPRFYPMPISPSTTNRYTQVVRAIFAQCNGQITEEQSIPLTTLCGLPSYMNHALFQKLIELQYSDGFPENHSPRGITIKESTFHRLWDSELLLADIHTRLFRLLRKQGRDYLIRDDFELILDDVLDRHPGLEFLKSTPEFQVRYSETVIGRLFYHINRSVTERITLREIKASEIIEILSKLDETDDVNSEYKAFSYEQFYVIYCRFYKLDGHAGAHDGLLTLADLRAYDDMALTESVLQRVVDGKARQLLSDVPGTLNYADWLAFFISEVDKSSPQAVDYWFNALDLDEDDVLTTRELQYFFTEQQERIQQLSQETVDFNDILCAMTDAVKHGEHVTAPERLMSAVTFTRKELKDSRMGAIFFNTIFNLRAMILGESRDPQRAQYIMDTPELNDFDRFTIQEYILLADNESQGDDMQSDTFDDRSVYSDTDTPSLNEQVANVHLSRFHQYDNFDLSSPLTAEFELYR